MKFEHTQVFNFEGALRGMRNPKESWERSDSYQPDNPGYYVIGQNDMRLAQSLIKAGSEHRKFLREIMVCVDITAPIFFWKQFDTYKVGTVSNSTSTMHKLATTPITIDCFQTGDYDGYLPLYTYQPFEVKNISDVVTRNIIPFLEQTRLKYLQTKDKRYWKELIRWLPESWLQKRTVTMSYQNLFSICSVGQRRNHKLSEWSNNFISWARTLPYAQEFIFIDETNTFYF